MNKPWHLGPYQILEMSYLNDISLQAALPVAPDTAASIASDLCQAEAAMPAGAFVGFPGTQQLYAALLDRRQPAASWRAACTGARALGSLFCRAKVPSCYPQ